MGTIYNRNFFTTFQVLGKFKITLFGNYLTGPGNKVRRFQTLENIEIHHFIDMFNEPTRANLSQILKLVSYFPRMVEYEENKDLYLYNAISLRNCCRKP